MSGKDNIIPTLNRLVRASRQLLEELGREPSAEELAERLAMPHDRVRRLMAVVGLPIVFATEVRAG